MDSIERFFQEIRPKRIAFIGIGVTNTGIIQMFLEKQVPVTVLDRRTDLGEDYGLLSRAGAQFRLGKDYLDSLEDFDIIFRSPGMYFLSEPLIRARRAGVAVVSEMEVFFRLCPCPIYGITGSDGKTTTSTLISEFLKAQGYTVHLGGNIGRALLPEIEGIRPEDRCVVELSSFQLLSMRQSPHVAVIKNVTPNHLDVHKDMDEYAGAKKNVLLHQDGFSRAVLNLDDPVTREMEELVRGELEWFSMKEIPDRGTFLDGEGFLCRSRDGKTERLFHREEIRLPGTHNVENYLTAIAAVGAEASLESIRQVARSFGGVEHRQELVRELDGVRYYNNSIASSPTRTIADLNSYPPRSMVLISGGYDKHIPYEPLAPVLCRLAKGVVLMGATGPRIEEALRACPEFSSSGLLLEHAATMEEAVQKARVLAEPGDVISLSPASASFDLYKNFEERGRHFKAVVMGLEERPAL